MKWDQIENNWALMTRRIRADWGSELVDAREVSAETFGRGDAAPLGMVETGAYAVKETEFKTSAK